MLRSIALTASGVLLLGSLCGAVADDQPKPDDPASPSPPAPASEEAQTQVEETLKQLKKAHGVLKNSRVVVTGPEGKRKTIEWKDDGSGNMMRIETDGTRRVLIVSPDGAKGHVQFLNIKGASDDENPPARHQIGVQCRETTPAFRLHLAALVGIPEEAGLIVHHVLAGSPAEQSGLQEHDLLIEAGGTVLTSVPALQQAIQQSEGKTIKLSGFRRGKAIDVEVTPTLETQKNGISGDLDLQGLGNELGGLLDGVTLSVDSPAGQDALREHLGAVRGLQLQRVGPAVLLDRPAKDQPQNTAQAIKVLARQIKSLSAQIEEVQAVVRALQPIEERDDDE